jgi:hypothetical protein
LILSHNIWVGINSLTRMGYNSLTQQVGRNDSPTRMIVKLSFTQAGRNNPLYPDGAFISLVPQRVEMVLPGSGSGSLYLPERDRKSFTVLVAV